MHSDVKRPMDANSDPHAPLVAQRLRELPRELQPPFEFAEFQRRVHERRHRRTFKPSRSWAAAAAFIAAIIAGVALWSRLLADAEMRTETESLAQVQQPLTSRQIDEVLAAERWLVTLPEPVVVRADTRMTVMDLEDRIALVDELLTSERLRGAQPRVVALQQERARLVNSLARVRYAETLVSEVP
ncbi:MAG TPA: hypothetical protein VIL32_06115 [Steroidobacteraceae bacterium]